MAPPARNPLRSLSFALPAFLLAVVGLGSLEAQAVPHNPHGHPAHLHARHELAKRDSVTTPNASSFVLNGLKGEAATTRNYDFVISEMTGAPDGFSKQMLVVNGMLFSCLALRFTALTFSRSIPWAHYRG